MDKEKHLESILSVISRLAQNSFTYKGLTVILVTGLWGITLLTKQLQYISIVPILSFWGLDAFYLRRERLFRALYNHVRTLDVTDFSMDISVSSKKVPHWFPTLFSKTIIWLYFPLLAVSFGFLIFT